MTEARLPEVHDMLADRRRASLAAGGLLLGGVLVCVLVWSTAAREVVQDLDDAFLRLMTDIRTPPLTALAKALAFLGGVWCTWTIRVVVLAILARRRHWVHLSAFVAAIVTSEVMIGTLKTLYDRPRPPGSLIHTTGGSFPSGHAIAAAVTAVGIVIVLLPPGRSRWSWERRAALYASAMALSRTYLAAHWLSDVVAGILLGGAVAIGWPALLVTLRVRMADRRSVRAP